jgi:hypothetical protein
VVWCVVSDVCMMSQFFSSICASLPLPASYRCFWRAAQS